MASDSSEFYFRGKRFYVLISSPDIDDDISLSHYVEEFVKLLESEEDVEK